MTTTISTSVGEIPSPSNWQAPLQHWLGENHSEIISLEKATDGRTTLEDISSALDEYKRLFKAGIASKAETLTLSRAFPDMEVYSKAVIRKGLLDKEPMVLGGPASVELVDREGHLITTNAMKRAFTKYMKNFRTRNAMVLHSDVQVGWALPAYISQGGQIFKSGVDEQGLFFITELRDDTNIAKKVMEQVTEGKLRSYSIAGSATKTQMIQKGMQEIMQVDDMELAEVTVCEKGVNQAAGFEILKADDAVETCIDGSCLLKEEIPLEGITIMTNANDQVDFTKSFLSFAQEKGFIEKAEEVGDFPTLYNTEGRKQQHWGLLHRMGWPSEIESETGRYIPVSEADQVGMFIMPVDPKIVNEAGQELGYSHAADALTTPTIGNFERGGVMEGSNSIEMPITKSYLNWMNKESKWKKALKNVKEYNDEANEEMDAYYKNEVI
jgi:HK97 family phage prohead protease